MEVGEEIVRGFEANAEVDDAVIIRRAAGDTADVIGDGETRDAGPAIAHLEKLERVDEGEHLLL